MKKKHLLPRNIPEFIKYRLLFSTLCPPLSALRPSTHGSRYTALRSHLSALRFTLHASRFTFTHPHPNSMYLQVD
jgi:hypothetical protein